MFWAEEDSFFVGAFDFDAVGFDAGIVFEGVVDDAAVEGVERFEFDDVTPAADFLGGFLGFLDEGVALLGAVVANVESDFRAGRIFFEDNAVGDVLKLAEGLALAADEAAGIVGLDVEEDLAFDVVLVHGRFETKRREELFKDCFWICCHK